MGNQRNATMAAYGKSIGGMYPPAASPAAAYDGAGRRARLPSAVGVASGRAVALRGGSGGNHVPRRRS